MTAPRWKHGDRIGDYQIIEHIKSGGMADLFLGRRVGAAGFTRHVAIKVVHSELSKDPAFVRMFIDEALLSSKIQHPHVVHVEEFGESNGTYFLVMEYVPGCSLSQLVESLQTLGRRMAPELAVSIAIRIADGLHAAHETQNEMGEKLGVVHRDVSPQNVLLAFRGYIKVIDFGIAKAQTTHTATEAGTLKGKYPYMSPEQAAGEIIDRRTDVYALGIVLWEMLTMRRLFDAPSVALLLQQVRNPRITPPSVVVSDVPSTLDSTVLRALSPKREARYRTVNDFRMQLAECMPEALTIDASQLSELLLAVMPEEIQRVHELLGGKKREATKPPRARIVVIQGARHGDELVFDQSQTRWVLGRGLECSFVLRDIDTSRQHFEFGCDAPGIVMVRDLNSKNGLFVNGDRIQEKRLVHGDEIQAGRTILRYEELHADLETPKLSRDKTISTLTKALGGRSQ